MKLIITIILFSSNFSLAEKYCPIAKSRASRVVLIENEAPSPDSPNIPAKVTQIGTTVSTITSTITALNPTQISQGSRALALFNIASCTDNLNKTEALSLTDSPTQLAIGNSPQRYNLGAIAGNWILLGSTTLVAAAASAKLGTEKAHFPGVLTIPVAFLMEPTMAAGVSLVREGSTWTQQLTGGYSITVQILGIGLVAVFLHPSHFQATKSKQGYAKRYGMMFEAYGANNQGFVSAELLMSAATGIIQSFQSSINNCAYLVTASGITSTAYALSLIIRQPHRSSFDRVFYTGIATVQAIALDTLAFAMWFAYEETKQQIQRVVETTMLVTQWALFAKTLADQALRIYSYCSPRSSSPALVPQQPALTLPTPDPLPSDRSSSVASSVSIEMDTVLPVLPLSAASSRPTTPEPATHVAIEIASERSSTTSPNTTPPGPDSDSSQSSFDSTSNLMKSVAYYIKSLYGDASSSDHDIL